MSDVPLLKQHREKSNKTQGDVARILSDIIGQPVNQSQVSRWEDDPDSIPARMMRPLTQALGISIEDLFLPPVGQDDMRVNPGAPYEQLQRNIGLLRSYLETAPSGQPPMGVPDPAQVDDLCARLSRKPNVVLSGRFDAGKSRLCNALLGQNALPARYRPTTAAGTWLRHTEDRPAWCDESVYIYQRGFDPSRFTDARYCHELEVASGGFETLASHAIHRDGKMNTGDYTAVVFLDAPLLRACNLVDLPGHQHNEGDARLAEAGLQHADVLIYLSTATNFLNGEDLAHLRAHLRNLPIVEANGLEPLANFFVVVSQAHSNIGEDQLREILEDGADTLVRELGDTVFAERAGRSGKPISRERVRSRIYPFWFERAERREPLQRALTDTLGVSIPAAWRRQANLDLDAFRKSSRGVCEAQIEQWTRALRDLETAKAEHAVRVEREANRRKARAAQRARVATAIAAHRDASMDHARSQFAAVVDEQEVERLIKRRYKKKDDATKHAPGAVIDLLQNSVAAEAERRAKELVPLVEAYLGQFGDIGVFARPDGTPAVEIAFDARGTFLGGMAGLGTIGALGAWAATLGNLGGYIIVAKVASLLAALGISVGGSAALVSLVAALGGPMVVGVAVAVVVGWVVSALFGESWERRLARKVVKALNEHDVGGTFEGGARKFWDDTERAFEQAADRVEAEYARQLDDFGHAINRGASTRSELEGLLEVVRRYRDFFAGLPWRELP